MRHDVAALGCDHNSCTPRSIVRIIDSLEERSRDPRCALDARLVVELAVAIRRTVLDPVSLLPTAVAHVAGWEWSIILWELVTAFEAWSRVCVDALSSVNERSGYLNKLLLRQKD